MGYFGRRHVPDGAHATSSRMGILLPPVHDGAGPRSPPTVHDTPPPHRRQWRIQICLGPEVCQRRRVNQWRDDLDSVGGLRLTSSTPARRPNFASKPVS
ncbi:hypothetical protein AVEN_116930-1 [Araneus ventricosus]|uniref:Uncharacterized protein n=1 Tax=Araneus ventricosus TaxID=182803 RepID=A0A4Y2V5G8_ARAVE|nr:hypothetical protein AVEN_116930-1 [Araneus ventricosus]